MKHQSVILLESVKPLFRLTENRQIKFKLIAIQVILVTYFIREYKISNYIIIEYIKDNLYNNPVSNIDSLFGEQLGFQQFQIVILGFELILRISFIIKIFKFQVIFMSFKIMLYKKCNYRTLFQNIYLTHSLQIKQQNKWF
ncbi:hypothetical protein pb186bvf_020233 [Paramecium bursaria]